MPEPLPTALDEVRELLLDPHRLVRAVASGRRRGSAPAWERAELRPVQLAAGRQLQVVLTDGVRPLTRNVAFGAAAQSTVDTLLAEPFGNWHVQTIDQSVQLRVTKRGEAQVHRAAVPASATPNGPPNGVSSGAHDRAAAHLLAPDHPIFGVIGGNAAKRRQVDAFLRALDATLRGDIPQPLRVVDLGCGNAYLTFAAYQLLSERGIEVSLTGVDVRDDQRERNTRLAEQLGWADSVRFIAGSIAEADVEAADLVLALHACDTATDDALARAVGWQASWILAAPCCHREVAAQLRRARATFPALTRDGILRERFADVLTDALRAALLRLNGYRVDVVEFVDSAHTPRNVMLRARRTGEAATPAQRDEYSELARTWRVTPYLATLLPADTAAERPAC